MARTIIEVFDEHFSHLKFNQHLATLVYRFQVWFVNKNEEHMAFFGGKLLGVQVVRFTSQDFSRFFDEVANIDPSRIKNDILHDVDDIKDNFKVAGDVFSLTCFYFIYRFLNSPLLDEKKRQRAAMDCALICQYRWIAALIRDYFIFPADPKLAQATYANLSDRYIIKKVGSWQEVMCYRAERLLSDDGIHKQTLHRFNDDLAIIYAVEDTQGRIRDMVKNIYGEMMKASRSGEKIHTTGSTAIDADGADIIKDRIHGVDSYITYILMTIPDRGSFIKSELVAVISQVMHTMQERGFVKVLEWMSDNISTHPEIEALVRSVLIHSFNYLLDHGHVLKNTKDLAGLLVRLKGVYVSSRSTDTDLLQLRTTGTELIANAIGKTNEQTVAAIRTGIFLYICLRSYTKHHYTG